MTICKPDSFQEASAQSPAAARTAPTNWLELQKQVAQEFADKVTQIPGVMGVVATTHEHLLHIWTYLRHRIPRDQGYAVYDAELEMFQKYSHQFPLDFESRSAASTEELKELLSCRHSYIVYQKEKD